MVMQVSVLKEHFSPYGDLSKVQVDDIDPSTSNVTAQIHFRTRHAAEKAFLCGKTWKGHNLRFVWLDSIDSRKDDVVRQTQSPFSKDSETPKGTEIVKDDSESYESHQSNCISHTG